MDLKLGLSLLNIKKEIEKIPSKNIDLIHVKVCELLTDFMFSSSHDGFRYYVEAVTRSYLRYPYKFPMLELYKEIANSEIDKFEISSNATVLSDAKNNIDVE